MRISMMSKMLLAALASASASGREEYPVVDAQSTYDWISLNPQ
jgi:hypothetical protein